MYRKFKQKKDEKTVEPSSLRKTVASFTETQTMDFGA